MSSLETLTVRSIAASAESAATLIGMGDLPAATAALERAERRLLDFSAGKPPHARAVRLAREAVTRARGAIEAHGSEAHTTRQQGAERRAAERAVARARA